MTKKTAAHILHLPMAELQEKKEIQLLQHSALLFILLLQHLKKGLLDSMSNMIE